MKKTILSITSVAAIVVTLLFACTKTDNSSSAIGVSYASQNNNGTGGNPNTTAGTTTSGGVTTGSTGTTAGSTTGSTTGNTTGSNTAACSFMLNTTNYPGTCSDNLATGSGNHYTASCLSSSYNCQIVFGVNCPTTPAVGSYNITTTTTPSATQCALAVQNGTSALWQAQSGTVSVTSVSGKLKFTFASLPVKNALNPTQTGTVSGTITQP